jgi:hypothetical protein
MNTKNMIFEISKDLRDQIIDYPYHVVTSGSSYRIQGLSDTDEESIPDIMILDENERPIFLIEVKGTYPSDELPYGTIRTLKRIKKTFSLWHPNLLLITPSSIPPQLQTNLDKEKIRVIKHKDNRKTLSELITIIEETVEAE